MQNPLPPGPQSPRPTPPPLPTNTDPFGPNVLVIDNTVVNAQMQLDDIFNVQNPETAQFSEGRHAIFFKPGQYTVNVRVGYYTTVHGLGTSPDDVEITGGVQSFGQGTELIALNNFWRGAENLSIIPTGPPSSPAQKRNMWAVSQATYLRRVHVKGNLYLYDFSDEQKNRYSSGGFIADSYIDGVDDGVPSDGPLGVHSSTQQQFLARNTRLSQWTGAVWNMVFVGDEQSPSGVWPNDPITVVDKTPVIREKPYLVFQDNEYMVKVPFLKTESQGTSWFDSTAELASTLPISQFYVADPLVDTASTLNDKLGLGYHLLLTPGVYILDESLQVDYPDTVILGVGMATLTPKGDNAVLTTADVDGISICGVIIDAGPAWSASLLEIGPVGSSADHSGNPTTLCDVSCRVGGGAPAQAESCFVINSHNVLLDNIWIWRADHGNPGDTTAVGWSKNPSNNGIIVNGDNVTAYGLFVEHFEQYQTLWNGNGGAVYFYQSELPYDVPDQKSWQRQGDPRKGYPSYKVADGVTSHAATGLGIYSVFNNPVQLDNAIETPPVGSTPGIHMNHMTTVWIPPGIIPLPPVTGTPSSINSIINGDGNRVYDNGARPPPVMVKHTSY